MKRESVLILTLHRVDELSVPAPQFPPLFWVIFAVLRVGWVKREGFAPRLSLGGLCPPAPITTILTGRSPAASPHSPGVDTGLRKRV